MFLNFVFTALHTDHISKNNTDLTQEKATLSTRKDVEHLVDTFYGKVKNDPLIGPIFSEVAGVDWNSPLPVMYDFWSGILLGEHPYSGNPMQKHIALSQMTPLTEKEFSRWLRYFNETVDGCFEGQKAEEAKRRAADIARLMLHKIEVAQDRRKD